jgi:hypothetical protein
MQKKQRLWVLLGGAIAALALLLGLGVALVWSPRGAPSAAAPTATETLWGAASSFAGQSEFHPGMAPHERLAFPPLSDPPTQVELGHTEYWMSCMVCHGDRGQGLTEEWREVLDPEDMNCWQSKCHAPNHPPEGFQVPRTSPLIMGPGALTGYETAEELYEYLRTTMPWPFPGLFQDFQYWQLTAFLLDANGVDMGEPAVNVGQTIDCQGIETCERAPRVLGPENAADILVIPQLVQTHKTPFGTEQVTAVVVLGLFVGAAVGYWRLRGS